MVDQSTCPLCKQENQCTADQTCWCMKKPVPKELIESARKKGFSEQCICQACIDRYLKLGAMHS